MQEEEAEAEVVAGDTVDVVSSTLKEETAVWVISGAEFRGAGVGSNSRRCLAPSSATSAADTQEVDVRCGTTNIALETTFFLTTQQPPDVLRDIPAWLREDGATSPEWPLTNN